MMCCIIILTLKCEPVVPKPETYSYNSVSSNFVKHYPQKNIASSCTSKINCVRRHCNALKAGEGHLKQHFPVRAQTKQDCLLASLNIPSPQNLPTPLDLQCNTMSCIVSLINRHSSTQYYCCCLYTFRIYFCISNE